MNNDINFNKVLISGVINAVTDTNDKYIKFGITTKKYTTKEDKNVMLVTHNDTLINQAPHLMTLVKENGFTEILK